MFELRDYQRESVEAFWNFIRSKPGNPCIELPTGAGKTPVIATIAKEAVDWGARVLILSHVKELVKQSSDTLTEWYPDLDVGIYSAGLNSRDKKGDVLVAGIQSIYSRGLELSESRPFNLVLVDEAHRIPTDGEGMYRTLFHDLEVASDFFRIGGLTATPYRLKGGWVCGPDNFLNEICYRVSVKDLIARGFLSRLVSKQTFATVDTSAVTVRGGEFVASDLEEAFDTDEKIEAAVSELLEFCGSASRPIRKSVIVFCCGVDHARHVADRIEAETGERVVVITGETNDTIRDIAIEQFKEGKYRFLVNVNVLTEGFDARAVDCVALMRSTLSPGLFYQMVGRGLRLHPSKDDCLVLDFGDNVKRHGCIDDIRVKGDGKRGGGGEAPAKSCPECQEIVAASAAVCPDCGFEFEINKDPKHGARASGLAITTDQVKPIRYAVESVEYAEHTKKNGTDDDPKTLRVSYYGGLSGIQVVAQEWVCPEHSGWVNEKFCEWWKRRTDEPIPNTAAEAARLGSMGLLAEPSAIWVEQRPGDRFSTVVKYELEDLDENVVAQKRERLAKAEQLERDFLGVNDSLREPGEDDEPELDYWSSGVAYADDDRIPF